MSLSSPPVIECLRLSDFVTINSVLDFLYFVFLSLSFIFGLLVVIWRGLALAQAVRIAPINIMSG